MVLGAKRYNHDDIDTFQLALDFEHRHHISIIKLETWSKRHATNIRGWRDSKEGATILLIGTLVRLYDSFLFPGSSFTDTSLSQPDQALRYSAYSPQQ